MNSKKTKYSLWLCPSSTSVAFETLNRYITNFATSYKTESFQPHLTLFSPIYADSDKHAIEQVRSYVDKLHQQKIDSNLSFLSIDIGKLATGNTYHQCILLEATHSQPFYDANSIARKHWNVSDRRPFYPHVSLVYGDFTTERKTAMAAEVSSVLPETMDRLSFAATDIRIIETVGSSDQWRDVARISIETGEEQ